MNAKKIGILIIVVGICLCVTFIDNYEYMVSALTVTVIGFLVTLLGYLGEVKKTKLINDQLNQDIDTVIQPLITKYSNLNKELRKSCSDEEYPKKRLELNRNLEKELMNNLPYLESREIKKIVINFSKEQDKLL